MKHLNLLAIPIVFLFMRMSSCDKAVFDGENCTGNCFEFKGKVIDSATGLGISQVKLELRFDPGYTIIGKDQLLVKATTNQSGEYSFRFDPARYIARSGSYVLSANHANYFLAPDNDAYVRYYHLLPKDYNIPQQYNFSMFTPASIKVNIKSADTRGYTSLAFDYSFTRNRYGNILNLRANLDTTLYVTTAAGLPTRLHWSTYGGGNVPIEKQDTLLVDRNIVPVYTIEF